MSSFAGVPDIVTAPLSAVTFKSFDVPLCALAVATVGVGNAVLMVSSSVIATPANPQATDPVFVPVTVKNALNVIVPYPMS